MAERWMWRLACVVLLGLGCTRPNPGYLADDDGTASADGSDDPAVLTSSGRTDGGATENASASADGDSTNADATGSSGGDPICDPECGDDATCIDEGSGPKCACDPGFDGDGFVCTAVASLDPLSWRIDCMGNSMSCFSPDSCVVEDPPEPHEVVHGEGAMLMGDPGTLYDVTLWVRGVVEPKEYVGGRTMEHWNEGGMPALDEWNVVYLDVEDPPLQLNVNAGPPMAHVCFGIDEEITVPIRGGSWVEIGSIDPNNCAIRNLDAPVPKGMPISIEGVDEPAQPHDGQFMLVEATNIVPSGG